MIPHIREITLEAHAKINLFLEVGEKRPDGYHDIASIMAEVPGLYDTVTVRAAKDISVTCSDSRIPTGMDNIACRAAAEYFRRTGISGGAEIHIEKRIPAAAGLAGGSTDGAAVFLALNEMYGALSHDKIMAAGAAVGADVPFCIMGGVCAAYGIGEKLYPVCHAVPGNIVVAIGASEKMSTAEAYGKIDALGGRDVRSADNMIAAVKSGDVSRIAVEMYNIFEAVTDHSSEIKRIMESCGAAGTLMSGSGPAVFGMFEDDSSAKSAAEALRRQGYVCG